MTKNKTMNENPNEITQLKEKVAALEKRELDREREMKEKDLATERKIEQLESRIQNLANRPG